MAWLESKWQDIGILCRNGNFDIYTIPVDGERKKDLTISDGLDDGLIILPDGKYIYFNSLGADICRYGGMQSDGTVKGN
jgi:Tol biopolymer transport system component